MSIAKYGEGIIPKSSRI